MNNKFPNSPSPNFQSSRHSPALPPGWTWTLFSEVVETIPLTGKKLKRGAYQADGKLPVIDQGQAYIGGFTDRAELAVNVKEPLVIFGDHTKVVKYIDFNFVTGADGVKVLKPANCYEPKFLFYLLHAVELPEKGYARHFQFLQKTPLPLPPLPEQRRIVAKIEELFSKLDAGVEALKKVKAGLKRYRQSVLKHAFEGRLTEEYRRRKSNVGLPADDQGGRLTRMAAEPRFEYGAEDASALLARIREERKKALGRKYKEPPPIDTSDLPALPEGWAWARMSEACTKVQDGTHFSPKVQSSEPGHHLFKYITAKNIRPFRLDLNDLTYIDESVHKRIYARCNPEQGDVLLTKDGVNTGMVAVNTLEEEFSVLSSIALLKPNRDVLTGKYLCYFIGSPIGQRLILGRMTGTAIKRIILERARNAEVPIAPIDEQQEIVSEIERRFSIADAVEKVVDESHKQAERLRQSILKRAFEGKLVPQDPSDEPAEVLLERIRVEKGTRTKRAILPERLPKTTRGRTVERGKRFR